MRLRHALILAINTSVLAVLFAFMAWLYRASAAEVRSDVRAELERAAAMTESLATLRERELSGLAQSLAGSAMVKGALVTQDAATITDVLRTVAEKNRLAWAGIAGGDLVFHASRGGREQTLARATSRMLVGRAPVGGGRELLLAEPPGRALLLEWSKITGVSYALSAGGGPVADDLDPAGGGLAATPEAGDPPAWGPYYIRREPLLGGRFEALLLSPREPYWASFRRRRNSLAVLGGALFLLGLLLSLAFAALIEGRAAGGAAAPGGDWQRLLDEIEALKRGRAAP